MRSSLLPLVAILAGCSSTPTRFWTIEPVAGAPSARPWHGAPVQVTAVHVPLAIDRLEVVQHAVANQVAVLDFDRWSAPPGSLLRTALTQDLAARLPGGTVVYPDAPAPAAVRRIAVDVLDLRRVGDRFILQASWTIAGPAAHPNAVQLEAPAGAGDVASESAALATMTGQLADAIAAGLG